MTETTTRREWTDAGGTHHVEYRDAEDRLHREDGPATTLTWSGGIRHEAWFLHDKLHRKGGPAITITWPNGTRHTQWWEDDKLHRKDGPAVTTTYRDGSRRMQWWEDGKYIREGVDTEDVRVAT